jgi:hypothetical protein
METESLLIDLCKNGKLQEAKQLYDSDNDKITNINDAFRVSCENGHIEVAEWLLDIFNNKYSLKTVDIHTIFHDNNDGDDNDNDNDDDNDDDDDNYHDVVQYNVFQSSCRNGQIEIAKWLHKLGGIDIHANNELAFRWSCSEGHIEVAKWLYSLGGVDINALMNDNTEDDAFQWSCKNGHVKVAKWLYSLLRGVDDFAIRQHAFRSSCINGHIKVAKWLYSLGEADEADPEVGVNIHVDNNDIFQWSCCFGHIEVAKWLYSLGGVDIHFENDNAFISSCGNGHIEVAKWIYSFGNMNIHFDNDWLFHFSFDENIEVPKWLYSLGGVDIHAHNDHAFRESCGVKNIEAIIFLLSIDNKYDYVHKKDNIVTKLLFDNEIKLSDDLMAKYAAEKQSTISEIVDHLIPDIADMIYYYI